MAIADQYCFVRDYFSPDAPNLFKDENIKNMKNLNKLRDYHLVIEIILFLSFFLAERLLRQSS